MTAAADSALTFGFYVVGVVGIIVLMLGLSHVLGQRHNEPATGEPFESGVKPVGEARLRFSAHFYLVAMLFVLFDLEAVFLFAWAIGFHDAGWLGFWGAMVFLLILTVALVYEWRQGALDIVKYKPRPSLAPKTTQVKKVSL